MDSIKTLYSKYKKIIIETAPAYVKYNEHDTLTTKLLKVRTKLGFTRLLYPGTHLEGEVKIFDRRFRTPMFKYCRLFGARGEVFYLFVFFYLFKKLATNSLEREKIEENLIDRDVFFVIKNIDDSVKKIK